MIEVAALIVARSNHTKNDKCALLVVFRILCHFVKLSKKEMTYDQNQFRHGCRFKAVA